MIFTTLLAYVHLGKPTSLIPFLLNFVLAANNSLSGTIPSEVRHLVALDALEFRKSKKIVEGKIFDQCDTHVVSSHFVLLD